MHACIIFSRCDRTEALYRGKTAGFDSLAKGVLLRRKCGRICLLPIWNAKVFPCYMESCDITTVIVNIYIWLGSSEGVMWNHHFSIISEKQCKYT